MTQANSASNSAASLPKFKKLVTLLKELFQLDQPDLDFGIYRIMHAKAGEITQFLERDLLPQVSQAFAQYQSADSSEIKKKIDQLAAQVAEAGMDPEASPKVRELREQLKTAIDIGALENEVYDHLFSFFRRYYSEGDFLAKRVYRPGVYAIPYEGEEVTLHWANKDQYYIKTSEYLRDYAFRLRPEADETKGEDPRRVHFRLVDAAEGEHGSVKAAEGKDRVFVLAREGFIAAEDGELDIRFEFRPATLEDWPEDQRADKKKPPAQKDLIALATSQILAAGGDFTDWLSDLARPHMKADGEAADYSRLEAHLRRYAARNTFDYFIHKDLGGFLRRELDFYIKNEVMHLDDVESETAAKVEQYLSKIKVVRRVAGKVIDFLAQLENFQKKLWLKKKFVTDSHYCVTLGLISKSLYGEIAANDHQRSEWVSLFAIDQIPGDLSSPGYSEPLSVEFLSAHPELVLDTRHFSCEFASNLIDALGLNDDGSLGALVNSDNFQALRALTSKYQSKIRSIYIDPPYNTGDDDFSYKDSYRHSSWLSMMARVTELGAALLSADGTFLCSIDDNEEHHLNQLLRGLFSEDHFVANIAYERSGSSGLGQGGKIVNTKENILAFSLNKASLNDVWHSRPIEFETLKRYNKVLLDAGERELSESFVAPSTGEDVKIYKHRNYRLETISLRDYDDRKEEIHSAFKEKFETIFRLTSVQKENSFQQRILSACSSGLYSADYLVSRGRQAGQRVTLFYMDGQIFVWLKDSARIEAGKIVKENKITDHWSHGEIPKADLANEGGVTLSRGKKPEQLLKRLVEWTTNPGDIVLDFFSGSGTTAAVACKTARKFVAVDNERYFDEKSLRRLKLVASGEKSGVSRASNWAGGGYFKYLRLESYEDTLNNLALQRSAQQQSALDLLPLTEN